MHARIHQLINDQHRYGWSKIKINYMMLQVQGPVLSYIADTKSFQRLTFKLIGIPKHAR